MLKNLIIGYGEVGKGLEKVLLKKYPRGNISTFDKSSGWKFPDGDFDIVHICFPYHEMFDSAVSVYMSKVNTKLCIVHSTVSPECQCVLNSGVVYSPVRGVHPNLADGIKTFVKIIASNDEKALEMADEFLAGLGIQTKKYSVREAIFAKLLSTTYYGACIAFADYAKKICDAEGLNFDRVYSNWNRTYNAGYQSLDKQNVVRPVLDPPEGIIGGHCVRENSELLSKFHNSPFLEMIQDLRKTKK